MKYGKLPARKNSVDLRLRDYLALTKLPSAPASAGHYEVVNSWGMLGNDTAGCCVWAGAGHETMLWNAEASRAVAFTPAAVLSDYTAVTGFNPNDPSTDQGTDVQVAASYRRKVGVLDARGSRHKVAAYLAITPGNREELKQAVYLFGAVGIGIEVPSSAQQQFVNKQPWTVVKHASIEGGHYIPAVGYDKNYVYVITWGAVQPVAWSFLDKYMDEGVAYLSTEALTNGKSLEGFDATQLMADLKAL